MPANECIPYKEPGSAISGKCVGAVSGKRFVKIVAARTGGGGGVIAGNVSPSLSSDVFNLYQIGQCSVSGEPALGVSRHDQADGGVVGVHAAPGLILPVKSGADIAFGQLVQTDASGQAIPQAVQDAVAASLTFGTSTSTVRVVADQEGTEGNDLSMVFVDPGGVSATLAVSTVGGVITVTLGRASSAINSTAAAVIAALNADPTTAALVTADNGTTGQTTGAGLVTAHAQAPLTGGLDGPAGTALGMAMTTTTSGNDAEIKLF